MSSLSHDRPAFRGHRFKIGQKDLHRNGDLFIIAEAGLAHDGSLGMAFSMIDAAAAAGADAIKFQTHIADQEGTPREKFRVHVFPQDETRQDYWRRTAFRLDQWKRLADHARENGILFLSSPFSERSVQWLIQCDVPVWKIASGEITNFPMIEAMCATGKPILVSSGMSPWQELDETLRFIEQHEGQYGVFQCTSAYPCPPEQWGLNVVDELLDRYDCPVGISDHSGTIVPSLAAVARGATIIEVHFVFSRQQFGPDSKASLEIGQLGELVQHARQLKLALERPVDKDRFAHDAEGLRNLFTKSVVAARALKQGHILRREDLAFKKPGDGISAKHFASLIGKTLSRDVDADHYFSDTDLI